MNTTPRKKIDLFRDILCAKFSIDGHCSDCWMFYEEQTDTGVGIDSYDDFSEPYPSKLFLSSDKVSYPCDKCGGTDFYKTTRRCADCGFKLPLANVSAKDKAKHICIRYVKSCNSAKGQR